MVEGQNTKLHIDTQITFAAHIRNPEVNAAPAGIEARRMKIYADLFFNNVKNFLSTTFPIAKSCLGDDVWLRLCRDFFHLHSSESPYFAEISQEFLTFLQSRREREPETDPAWLLELCHYEWVELNLDLAMADDSPRTDADDCLGDIRLSEEATCLSYQYPVHQIGPDHLPGQPKETHLVVFREQEEVRFMEVNVITMRLLQLLDSRSGQAALEQVVFELQQGGQDELAQKAFDAGHAQLREFASRGLFRRR